MRTLDEKLQMIEEIISDEDLKKKHQSKLQGYELVIYDIMLDLIEEEGLMESCIEMEEEKVKKLYSIN
ncbi:MAG TPA: DUF1788 domain-containing protein [Tepidimicrobium sp.]|nr:DUF1788 domain-containing protein [Tepidimicrobium sp.]